MRRTGRRADEAENNFIGIEIASVGHVYSDVAQHLQPALLDGDTGQGQLRKDLVKETAVAEAVAKWENRFSGVKLVRSARVGERRPG